MHKLLLQRSRRVRRRCSRGSRFRVRQGRRQPAGSHENRDAAIAAATAFAGLIGEPGENQEVAIYVSDSVQRQIPIADGEVPDELASSSVSVGASHLAKVE